MQKKKTGRPQSISKEFYEYDFTTAAKEAPTAGMKMKLLALKQLQSGIYYYDVAKTFQVHKGSVKNWMKRFLEEGLDGLKNKKGRGRKRILPESSYKDFKQAVIDLQKARPGGRVNAADITKMAKERFGVSYKTKSMYDVLHRINMVWISSRSVHPSQDETVQNNFKKTLQIPLKKLFQQKPISKT